MVTKIGGLRSAIPSQVHVSVVSENELMRLQMLHACAAWSGR